MGKAKRIKAQRAQTAARSATLARKRLRVAPDVKFAEKSDVRIALEERRSTRSDREIAIWLAQAVWRQQIDMNCLDASYTIAAALDEFGIENRVVPVAVIIDDVTKDRRTVLGRGAVDFLQRKNVSIGDIQRVSDSADGAHFWVDGGHAVVISESEDLLLDASFDQFKVDGLPNVFASLEHGTYDDPNTWAYSFGGTKEAPKAQVTYIEVNDVIELQEGARAWMSVAARELAFVGVVVDFDHAVVDPIGPPLYPSCGFLDDITEQLERDDFGALEALRVSRAVHLAAHGHLEPVPNSWGLDPKTPSLQ